MQDGEQRADMHQLVALGTGAFALGPGRVFDDDLAQRERRPPPHVNIRARVAVSVEHRNEHDVRVDAVDDNLG